MISSSCKGGLRRIFGKFLDSLVLNLAKVQMLSLLFLGAYIKFTIRKRFASPYLTDHVIVIMTNE